MCRPVDHYEYRNGKRIPIQVCITRDTEEEALRDALDYKLTRKKQSVMTFGKALQRFLDLKEGVISPTTMRSYRSRQKTAYELLNDVKVSKITTELVQAWVSQYAVSHKPKTVSNAYSLIVEVMKMFRPEFHCSVTLPRRYKKELYTPTDEDIRILLNHTKGTELHKGIMLAAFGTLRRGEVCALTFTDIKEDSVHVNKSMSYTSQGWLVKAPKNDSSIRTVKLPRKVIEALTEHYTQSGRVVDMNPEALRKEFKKALRECGLPDFRFHDLRAYSVSARHAIGIPDQYIMSAGGYKTDTVMKQIYRRTMSDKEKEFSDKVNEHFESIAT